MRTFVVFKPGTAHRTSHMNRFQKCFVTGLLSWIGVVGLFTFTRAAESQLWVLSSWLSPLVLSAFLWLVPLLWLAILGYAIARAWS